jgi:hypothetical protein
MRASMLSILGLLLACDGGGDRDPDSGPADTGVVADTGTPDSGADSGVRDTGAPDTGAPIPEVTVGDPYGEADAIDPAGDTDLFQFQAVEGQWLRIFTRHGNSPVDPVVTLFDASMTRLAESDDDIPRTGTDSEINFHVPASGTYFLEVQEFSTWNGDMPMGGSTYVYTIRIRVYDDAEDGVMIDPETGDTAASAIDDELGTILGTFRDTSDVDVYRFRNPSTSSIARYSVAVLPAGPDGQGSTTPAGRVWLTDRAGARVLASVDGAIGNDALEPPVNQTDYLLWVAHPGSGGGSNDYYVLKSNLFVENPPERMDGRNETLPGAELLDVVPDGMNRRAFVLADLDAGDVDYFRFDVMAGEEMFLACAAESSGSGVRDLVAEIRDPMDVMMMSAMEDPTGLFIMPFVPTSTGAMYVRLAAGTPEAMVAGRWVRCGMSAGPPAP